MATKEFWIQLENRPWDACPNNISRMDGRTIEEKPGMAPPVDVTLTSTETGVVRTTKMFLPVNDGKTDDRKWKVRDALILRRYTENWETPHDHKVNPWDLNEQDPSDNGTMGTIPGPTIECNVGDKVIVHFRNKDNRTRIVIKEVEINLPLIGKIKIKIPVPEPFPVHERTHSLHPHGIVFSKLYDGAYPLSPPDPSQPVGAEASLWGEVGVTGLRKGDRVPPGGTFIYTWDTFGWPATAGVWHYHDHSICDVENVLLGAIAFLVIHNPEDPDDVIEQDNPGGIHGGSPIRTRCFPFPFPVTALPHDLEGLAPIIGEVASKAKDPKKKATKAEFEDESPIEGRTIMRGDLMFELDRDLVQVARLCLPVYVDPPEKAQYLQYYHEMPGVGMCISGRRFMGNTPTLIAGPETKMRFGLAAMNKFTFHTFHLHGHRWVIPGPAGTTPGDIQSSPQIQAASQFEDTKIFGPANSFSLTINQGSFMGSRFTPDPSRASGLGEWHMHCHVLDHMMPGGMMGSLLVINGGELAFPQFLPRGVPCPALEPEEPEDDGGVTTTVVVDNFAFTPGTVTVASGAQVAFDFQEANHTVTTDSRTGAAVAIEINNGGGPTDAVPVGQTITRTTTGNPGDEINYICGIHGASMPGKIIIS